MQLGHGADHVTGACPFSLRCAGLAALLRPAREKILARIFRLEALQFLQQVSNALVHRFGHHHLQLHVQVSAPAVARADGTPFSRNRSFCPLLVPGHAQLRAPVERRHFDSCPQGGPLTVMGTTV